MSDPTPGPEARPDDSKLGLLLVAIVLVIATSVAMAILKRVSDRGITEMPGELPTPAAPAPSGS